MPHNHVFSDALFARLQSHAVPLVDTIDSVVERALDALEAAASEPLEASGTTVHSLNPAAPPNLAHTTPKAMFLDGKRLAKSETYWNTLMHEVIRTASKKGLSVQYILDLMVVPGALGEKTNNGYKYLPDVGISVQGQDANGAWKQAYHIAETLNIPVKVEFSWQNKKAAAMPNATAVLQVHGAH